MNKLKILTWDYLELSGWVQFDHNCPYKWRRKWQPTPVFLLGESQGQRSLVGFCLWDRTESDKTEATWQQWQWQNGILLPGKSHGRRSLVGCSPWGCEESDTTERLHFHFSLSCSGEGNGNPLQCSCPENPRDGGAWWAAVYGVAQSRTRLKRLSKQASKQVLIKQRQHSQSQRRCDNRDKRGFSRWYSPAGFVDGG